MYPGRFAELLVLLDTCHAAPMVHALYTPGVLAVAASQAHEESLSVRIMSVE